MSSLTGNMGYRGNTGGNLGLQGSVNNSTGFKEKRPHGYQFGAMQQFSPEQMQLFQSLFGHLGPDSYLSRLAGGDEETFNQMEAPALRQFNDIQANIGNRFSGMGMGAQKSSGFQNTMSSAASNFAQDLQSQRQGLQRQAINDLMGLSNTLLQQRPFDRFLIEKQQKQGHGGLIGTGIGAGVGGLAGFFTGGPAMAAQGALHGAKWGNQIGSAF